MTARFFLVTANRSDTAAIEFAAAAAPEVRLMTPADLSQPGWWLRLGDAAGSMAVIAGEPVSATAIAGVLTRLPGVNEHDLPHIAASDRAYVAAEMSAFLLAWLTSLTCPVVNRPTPQCLCGPMWRQEQWVVAASRLAIPARPIVRREMRADAVVATVDHAPGPTTVVIVGRRHVGTADNVLVRRSRALAQAAGVDLLSVQFDGPGRDARFVGASPSVDLGEPRIAKMVMQLLRGMATPDGIASKSDDITLGHFAG
jgi:hypothetical protein